LAFYLSPSVNVKETDLSSTIPAVATSITGMVGIFDWGQCFERVQVSSDRDLLEKFGRPNDQNFNHWYQAWNNLQYNNNLLVVRAVDPSTSVNGGFYVDAVDSNQSDNVATTKYIPNTESIESTLVPFNDGQKMAIFAKYPSNIIGNKISVALANSTDFETAEIINGISFASQFDFAPVGNEFCLVVLFPDEQTRHTYAC